MGGYQKPGPPGADPRKATSTGSSASSTYDAYAVRCAAEMSGPISASSARGSSTTTPRTAGSSSPRKRS